MEAWEVKKAFGFIIDKWEGGFVNDPHDAGGVTNMGVTQKTLERYRKKPVTVEDVKNLTREEAIEIYFLKYYLLPKFNLIENRRVLRFCLDFGVHSSPRRAIKYLQKVVGATEDGILGPKTAKAVETYLHLKGESGSSIALVNRLVDERILFLLRLVRRKPTQAKFIVGWYDRVNNYRSY